MGTIKERIQELCREKGITIQKLEAELGYSNASIAKINTNVKAEKLKDIADYFGVTMEYLMSGAEYEIFKKLSDERCMITDKVAKDIGMSADVLADWKKGVRVPNYDMLLNIANYLKVPVTVLTGTSSKLPYVGYNVIVESPDSGKIVAEVDPNTEDRQAGAMQRIFAYNEKLSAIFKTLSDTDKEAVLNFAKYLQAQKAERA